MAKHQTPKHQTLRQQTLRQQTPKQINNPVIESLSGKNGFYILLGLLCALALFVFNDFIFLNKVFLYKDIASDSVNANYPLLFHIADYFQNLGGIPRWTFFQGMGQNYLGYLTADPFDIPLYFTSPENIVYVIGLLEILKIFVAGIFFYLFLREIKLTPFTAVVGAVCFAFCGFVVLGGPWRIFPSELYQASFLLFSIEKLLKKKWYYFPFAIALIGVTVTFNLFIYSIVAAVYVFVRLFNQRASSKMFAETYGKMVGLGVLGVGMSAFISVNKTLLMLDSPRVSGSSSYFSDLMSASLFQTDGMIDNLTKIGRLFSSDMLGSGIYFRGAENYLEAPLFYVGLLSLLLFTQFFPFLSKRQKWVFGMVFICALLPFIFPFFRYALWLFSGKYYRGVSFLFGLVLLMYAVLSLNHLDTTRKLNYKVLFGTLLGIIVLLFIPDIIGFKKLFQSNIQLFCMVFLLLYTLLICLFPVRQLVRYVKPILVILIFIELAFMANITVNQRVYDVAGANGEIVRKDAIISYKETKSKTGYNDYSIDAIRYINSIDTSFYRIEKTYRSGPAMHSSLNDPLVQRYYGTTSYSSFNQSNYTKFLLATVIPEGSNEWATRWLEGLVDGRPLLQIFGNVHYNLSKTPMPPHFNDSIAKIGDVYIYKNKFSLPFGYTYSKYMLRSVFESLAFKDVALLEAVIVADDDAAKYASLQLLEQPKSADTYGFEQLVSDLDSLQINAFRTTKFSQNHIKGNISTDEPKLLFFTIPFDKDWKLFVDGEKRPLELVNIGFSGILLEAGMHEIELRFEPAGFYPSIIVSLLSLVVTLLLIGWFYWGKQKFCSKHE